MGGALFAWLKTPLPWMIGPLLLMAAFNFSGARLRAPPGGRQAGQVIIGAALGLYFTPLVARQVASYWHLLLLAALLAILIACACAWLVSTITDTDRTTAFFSSVPGGAAEMAVLAERYGARVDRVAVAQSMRILSVVIVIPFAFTYSGVHGSDVYVPATAALDWSRLGLLLMIAAAGGGILSLMRAPNGFMLGATLQRDRPDCQRADVVDHPSPGLERRSVTNRLRPGWTIRTQFSRPDSRLRSRHICQPPAGARSGSDAGRGPGLGLRVAGSKCDPRHGARRDC